MTGDPANDDERRDNTSRDSLRDVSVSGEIWED